MFPHPHPAALLVPAIFLFGSARAAPAEEAIVVAMRLSEQANYSWVASVSDDARNYDIVGQTRRDGFSRVSMPVVNSLRRRLARGTTDMQLELIFFGNTAWVAETEKGWKTLGELMSAASVAGTGSRGGSGSPFGIRGGSRRSSLPGSNPGAGWPPSGRGGEPLNYSNLQLGLSLPHEELGVIVSNHQNLQVEGHLIMGVLTELGAQLLLVRDGQEEITPVSAAGTFTLWQQDGMIVKYQVKLQGTLRIETPAGQRTVEVIQTTDTVIKNVGKTSFEVPEQARSKLANL